MIQNEIINGISIKIFQLFGNDYKIYSKNVKQGLENPCFFIQIINSHDKPYLDSRRIRKTHFMIDYFPADDEENESLYDVAEKLTDGLKFIKLQDDSILMGNNISHNVDYDEEVLHFEIYYDVPLINTDSVETMEILELEQRQKG